MERSLRLTTISCFWGRLTSELTEVRRSKDEFMASDHNSPLTPEQQRTFSSLAYYDEMPDL